MTGLSPTEYMLIGIAIGVLLMAAAACFGRLNDLAADSPESTHNEDRHE